jgi:hypothetical protein
MEALLPELRELAEKLETLAQASLDEIAVSDWGTALNKGRAAGLRKAATLLRAKVFTKTGLDSDYYSVCKAATRGPQ